MPKPRQCASIACDIFRDHNLCCVMICGAVGNLHLLLAVCVGENVLLKARFGIASVGADAVREPASMVSIDMPTHCGDLTRLVRRLNGARLQDLLLRFVGNTIIVVTSTNIS